MSLAVLLIGTANQATLRALPHGLHVVETDAAGARAAARALACDNVLIVEPEARIPAPTFLAAAEIDAHAGLVGGCASEAGMLRFGSVFSSVPFGPYAMEPFPLVDVTGGAQGERPPSDAIDAVSPGAFVIDRKCFVENAGGFDSSLGSPWRAYDLSMRVREAGRPLRWDPMLAFALETGLTRPNDAVDHRDFMRRWAGALQSRFDLDMPVRGGIRRAIRLPMGQREALAVHLPPVEVLLHGEGPLTPAAIRASTRVRLSAVRDARGPAERGVKALRDVLQSRADRYLVTIDATAACDERWLERMLMDVEWAANVGAVAEAQKTLLSLSRIPLDIQPAGDASSVTIAVDGLLAEIQRRSRIVRGRAGAAAVNVTRRTPVSVVVVAQSVVECGRTSFEAIYAGDLGVDYHAVATPARAPMLEFLKGYPTIHRIIDDSRSMATGINAAFARCEGEIVVLIGDEFFPPRYWIDMLREAFAARPETGILGFSSVTVDGPQCVDAGYTDIKMFHTFAAARRATMRREAHLAHRLAALALAIDARALRAVGGFDERLGAGRWGIEDLTLRMRAAGYEAYVAQDLFAHRFPPEQSQPYLNDPAEESRRAEIFAAKWGLRAADLSGFNPAPLIARGFAPERDFIPLREIRENDRELRERYDAVFVAACAKKGDVDAVAAVMRRYFQAFKGSDDVLFAVAVAGELDVETVSARARAVARKLNVTLDDAADVVIAPLGERADRWLDNLAPGQRWCVFDGGFLSDVTVLDDLSPSGLRRAVTTVPA